MAMFSLWHYGHALPKSHSIRGRSLAVPVQVLPVHAKEACDSVQGNAEIWEKTESVESQQRPEGDWR